MKTLCAVILYWNHPDMKYDHPNKVFTIPLTSLQKLNSSFGKKNFEPVDREFGVIVLGKAKCVLFKRNELASKASPGSFEVFAPDSIEEKTVPECAGYILWVDKSR